MFVYMYHAVLLMWSFYGNSFVTLTLIQDQPFLKSRKGALGQTNIFPVWLHLALYPEVDQSLMFICRIQEQKLFGITLIISVRWKTIAFINPLNKIDINVTDMLFSMQQGLPLKMYYSVEVKSIDNKHVSIGICEKHAYFTRKFRRKPF